ncbi:trigger factor [Candidatus Aerophobetes bacterium]|nr:trigger factor [Candidatus Aerophobetes bacterium]
MQIKLDKKENSELTFEIEIPKETVNDLFAKAFKKVAREAQVPGFRKGKAPRKIFEKKYGKKRIKEEAAKQLYPLVYNKIQEKEKINPLTTPHMELVKFSENEAAVVKLKIVTKPDVDAGSYKGVKTKRKKIKVEEEEVNQALNNLQRNYAEYPPLLENRPTQEGDWLRLEIAPVSAGKEGILSLRKNKEDIWYKLGSEQLPPSFHRELLGAKVGDEKPIETMLPPEHPQKELAGEKINLQVKVKDIRKERLPELNDEFAKRFNFDTIELLKNRIKEDITSFKERKEEERVKMEILEKIVKNSRVDVPPTLVEKGLQEKHRELEEELQKRKMSKNTVLEQQKLTEDELNKRFRTQAELELKTLFVLDKIAHEEKIEVTEKEVEERLHLLVQRQDKTTEGEEKQRRVKELKENLIKEGSMLNLIERMRNEKVIEFLYSQAQISEGILSSLK